MNHGNFSIIGKQHSWLLAQTIFHSHLAAKTSMSYLVSDGVVKEINLKNQEYACVYCWCVFLLLCTLRVRCKFHVMPKYWRAYLNLEKLVHCLPKAPRRALQWNAVFAHQFCAPSANCGVDAADAHFIFASTLINYYFARVSPLVIRVSQGVDFCTGGGYMQRPTHPRYTHSWIIYSGRNIKRGIKNIKIKKFEFP